MRKGLSLLFLLVVSASAVLAQSAEKAAAASSVVNQFVFSTGNSGPNPPFVTVLSTSIKPPGGKDLFITFSAQTGVFTTSVNNDVPAATATLTDENIAIQVRVLLDGVPIPIAPPSLLSIVALDNLIRETGQLTPGRDFLTLVVDEGGARSYTWIARDVGTGDHTVAVQARFLFFNASFPLGNTFSSIRAVLGPKTLTVEEVNLNSLLLRGRQTQHQHVGSHQAAEQTAETAMGVAPATVRETVVRRAQSRPCSRRERSYGKCCRCESGSMTA